MDTEVTFPKVTLWCSGVHLQDRTSITAYIAPIYRSRSGLPGQKIALPRQNRAWIFFRLKSSVDNLPLCRVIESKVADYPRSFSRREIFHARASEYPRSMTTTNLVPASVSICNSKRIIPPLSVTDRDVSQRPQLTSHSVTVRTVFRPFLLQIETNLKLGCAKPADLSTKKKRALSHRGTEPETLMEPVTGIEPATH